ncbi:MAG: hypothetical protein WC700_04650 [Gemmatimonadaceae bacterium]
MDRRVNQPGISGYLKVTLTFLGRPERDRDVSRKDGLRIAAGSFREISGYRADRAQELSTEVDVAQRSAVPSTFSRQCGSLLIDVEPFEWEHAPRYRQQLRRA